MKQLHNTIQRLTNNPNKSVTVTNLDTGEKIVCNKKGSFLIEEHGSIEEFFNSISASGVTKIRVSDRNPSGTSSTPDGEPYNVSLVPDDGTEVKQKTAVLEQEKPPIMPALNGDFGSIGLNAAQIDIAGKLYDYPRVLSEMQSYKTKSERLENELQELKTKVIVSDALENKSVAKIEANAKFMEPFAPLLAAFGEKMLGNASPVAAPAALAGISAGKQQVVAMLAQLDDSTAFYVGKLIEKLSEDDVWNDFSELLKKYNLADA